MASNLYISFTYLARQHWKVTSLRKVILNLLKFCSKLKELLDAEGGVLRRYRYLMSAALIARFSFIMMLFMKYTLTALYGGK